MATGGAAGAAIGQAIKAWGVLVELEQPVSTVAQIHLPGEAEVVEVKKIWVP